MCLLLGQESFYLHPVKEGFWTEDLNLVDGRINRTTQFNGTQVEGGIIVRDSVDALLEQYGKIRRLGGIDYSRIMVVFFADD